ncbi:MAG: toxin-activating lysine-acyltransferase [Pseudomonadota bacterium]
MADDKGASVTDDKEQTAQIDPEIAKKITQLRSTIRENFGKVAMAMMMVPRYRAQTLADLNHLLLDPMLQDRIAIAYPGKADDKSGPDMTGFAIWASVSEEVDTKVREQVANGVFPVRLKPEEWNSGEINWLLDVIAPDRKTTATVIANFRQVVKGGELRLHPVVARMVEPEVLEKMGARKTSNAEEPTADGK